MKKIGIITLNGYFNFGNRLQNYALTKVLENLGYDVYTLWNKKYRDIVKDYVKSKIFFVKKYNRFKKFYRFSKKNMKEVINKERNIEKLDCFVVGSDQVWNYKLMDKDHTWFEAPKGKVTISYAASLGTNKFPKEFEEKLGRQLEKYDAISVREKQGKELLEQILQNKDISLSIDPTLLLRTEEWRKIEKKPKKLKEQKYILIYFLGDVPKQYDEAIRRFAEKCSYQVINILNPKEEFFDVGPEEFLYLIGHAQLVCTDSFHASIFSFRFNKAFVVFKRSGKGISNDIYSRLESLLSLFQLNNRIYNGKEITNENLKCNYEEGYKILEGEIDKAYKFLRDNLDIKS